MTATDKQHAHSLLDRVPADQMTAAVRFLEFLVATSAEEEDEEPVRNRRLEADHYFRRSQSRHPRHPQHIAMNILTAIHRLAETGAGRASASATTASASQRSIRRRYASTPSRIARTPIAERSGPMGYEARKTEHCGPKRGNGAYWGYKWQAKKESNRIRRENWKREIRNELKDVAKPTAEPVLAALPPIPDPPIRHSFMFHCPDCFHDLHD